MGLVASIFRGIPYEANSPETCVQMMLHLAISQLTPAAWGIWLLRPRLLRASLVQITHEFVNNNSQPFPKLSSSVKPKCKLCVAVFKRHTTKGNIYAESLNQDLRQEFLHL